MNREPRALNSLSIDIARKGTWKDSIPTGKGILGGIPMPTGGVYRVHLVGLEQHYGGLVEAIARHLPSKALEEATRRILAALPARLKMISVISILFLITKSSILTGQCRNSGPVGIAYASPVVLSFRQLIFHRRKKNSLRINAEQT